MNEPNEITKLLDEADVNGPQGPIVRHATLLRALRLLAAKVERLEEFVEPFTNPAHRPDRVILTPPATEPSEEEIRHIYCLWLHDYNGISRTNEMAYAAGYRAGFAKGGKA